MANEGEISPEVPATPDDGEEKTPLFERLGGAAALDAAVELLFAKILDDELLAPVFAEIDMDQQKRMMSTFLSMVTGGPPEYDGRSMKDAHAGLGITASQFDAVAAHLSDALIELEVSVEDHDEILVVAASTKDDIVDAGTSAAADANAAGDDGHTTGSEINVNSFNELALPTVQIEAIRNTLNMVISAAPSRDAAADTFYQTIFDASRIIQPYFVSPRAVQALKFVQGIAGDLAVLDDPPQLKILLETRSFGHLALPVSVPLVIKVRDAIMDLFSVELGDKFTSVAKAGWNAYLNYVGGAYIYVKVNYAERLGLIRESWSIANGSNDDKAGEGIKDAQSSMMSAEGSMAVDLSKKDEKETKGNADVGVQNVPKTYPDMFKWNAVVTGLSGSLAWMAEVVDSFHNVVTNIANGKRLEEECDFLTIRICRTATGKINLADYKGCMLASLRSLLPNQWTNKHEFAWSWLWDNVERLLNKDMGKPPAWEKAYASFVGVLDGNPELKYRVRKEIYDTFFALEPAGQDYFKQSTTYLHAIADRVFVLIMEIYTKPVEIVAFVSAMGLRHVGYAMDPTLFPVFVSATILVAQKHTQDEMILQSLGWAMSLLGKTLQRTTNEGSTVVMKAIQANSKRAILRAIADAPRGERFTWMLNVQVGTESISPLVWSISNGKMEGAKVIIQDLLTIRADRDRYYYGINDIFTRHEDIVKRLADDAPQLIPTLLDGLIWRSRLAIGGMRRVNYFIKHMIVDLEGGFAKNIDICVKNKDPKLVCHPCLVLVADVIWSRIASVAFLWRRSFFLFNLVIFVVNQSLISNLKKDDNVYMTIFIFRCLIYGVSMTTMLYDHLKKLNSNYRNQQVVRLRFGIPVPRYLHDNMQEVAKLCLVLLLVGMLCTDPIFMCWGTTEPQWAGVCDGDDTMSIIFSVFAMLVVFTYFGLCLDLSVMFTRVSAYVLVCTRMLTEVALFLLAIFALIFSFGSAMSCLKQDNAEFQGLHKSMLALLQMVLRMYSAEKYEKAAENVFIMCCVLVLLIMCLIFLLNLLAAQLSCAYQAIYDDMVGFARLNRMKIIVETIATVKPARWKTFVQLLKFHRKLEFNEGDIGLPGGIATAEASSLNPLTIDMIFRFGGNTNPANPWPDEGDDAADRFEMIEKMCTKALQKGGKADGAGGGGSDGSVEEGEGGGSAGSQGAESEHEEENAEE